VVRSFGVGDSITLEGHSMFYQVSGGTLLKDIKKPINYVFIVMRNNVIEDIKVFKDASDAVPYTDNFIMNIDKTIVFANLPRYSDNESYSKDGLTISLLMC
jgi:hypothetical protein